MGGGWSGVTLLPLTFLGGGGAFAKRNYQSNVLVEAWHQGPQRQPAPDETLLIDFGTTGPLALHDLKDRPGFEYLRHGGQVDYRRIRNVLITHLHADHVGGLEELALMNTYIFGSSVNQPSYRPRLISSADVLRAVWDESLRGGLGVMHGRPARLEDYFEPVTLMPADARGNSIPLTDHYRLEVVRTRHVTLEAGGDWPSVGVRLIETRSGRSVFYTGDTQFNANGYAQWLEEAKLCFHDVQLTDAPGSVHALLSELQTLPESIRRKIVLYHFGDDWDAAEYGFVSREFAGFAVPQRRYDLFP